MVKTFNKSKYVLNVKLEYTKGQLETKHWIIENSVVGTAGQKRVAKKELSGFKLASRALKERIEIEEYELEVSANILNRTREEYFHVREKLKEMSKCFAESQKRAELIQLIQYANGDTEEQIRNKLRGTVAWDAKRKKLQANKLRRMKAKHDSIKQDTTNTRQQQREADINEQLVKERMQRLRANIDKIHKREQIFDEFALKRQNDTASSIEKYQFMQKIFGTSDTERISQDFCRRAIIKQSQENKFADLTEILLQKRQEKDFELAKLEKLKRQLADGAQNTKEKRLYRDKGEYNRDLIEHDILDLEKKSASYQQTDSSRSELRLILEVLSGMRNVMFKIPHLKRCVPEEVLNLSRNVLNVNTLSQFFMCFEMNVEFLMSSCHQRLLLQVSPNRLSVNIDSRPKRKDKKDSLHTVVFSRSNIHPMIKMFFQI